MMSMGHSVFGTAQWKAGCFAAAGLLASALAPQWASADTISPPIDGTGSASVQYGSAIDYESTGLPLVAKEGTDIVSVYGTPDPHMSASISGDGGNSVGHGIFNYYFNVVPDPGTSLPNDMTVDIATNMKTTAGIGAPGGTGQADAYLWGTTGLLEHVCTGCTNATTSSYSGKLLFEFDPLNDPQHIELSMDLYSFGAGSFATASIDPVITIDSALTPNADKYHLVFSSNISNAPIPATLPLFVSGLGILGYVARRKKRAQATAAA
jgi:hypothetical protein